MVLEVNLWAYLLLFCLTCGQMVALLWAGGAVVGLSASPGRLTLGAVVGASYAVLVDLAGFGVVRVGLLNTWYVMIGVSLLCHAVTYWPLPSGRRLAALGSYYLLAVVGAGVAYAVYNLGARGWIPPLLATGSTLVAAELGWGVVQSWVWNRVLYLPIEVELLGRVVRVTALLDTGNRLTDPLTGQPVVILSSELRHELLPEEADRAVIASAGDPAEGVRLLSETSLAPRLRLIPYSTLGRENGLLVAFRADAVRLVDGGPGGDDAGGGGGKATLIAFHQQPLDPSGGYGALVHPSLLRTALAQASRRHGRLVLGHRLGVDTSLTRPGG